MVAFKSTMKEYQQEMIKNFFKQTNCNSWSQSDKNGYLGVIERWNQKWGGSKRIMQLRMTSHWHK